MTKYLQKLGVPDFLALIFGSPRAILGVSDSQTSLNASTDKIHRMTDRETRNPGKASSHLPGQKSQEPQSECGY